MLPITTEALKAFNLVRNPEIWTAIGHDISNTMILPNCYLRQQNYVIVAMLIILFKPF